MTGILNLLAGSIASAIKDTYFNLVTLLLPGNGTNGAQNNTFLDSSTNNFTITRNGNTTQGTFSPFSQTGWSNYFDGSGDNIVTPSNTAFDPSGSNITVDCFVYLTRYANVNNIVFEVGASAVGDMQCNILNTGEVRFTVGGSTGSTISGFTLNTWHYITCVKSGTNFTVYLNGTAGTTVSLTANSKTQMYIGSQSGGNNIDGYLSNFRYVKGSANVPSGVPTTPLTAITNTSLLICQSNRFIDNSTNAFALTVNGNVSVQAFSPFAPTAAYSAASVGGSGYFDGTGDMLATPSITIGTNNFCFECWFYPTATQGATAGIFVANTNGGAQFSYYSTTGLGIANKGVGWLINNTNSVIPIVNQWNHIAFVRSGTGTNQASVFLNGTRIVNGTVSTNFSASTYELSTTQAGGTVLQGYITDARLTNGSTPYDATQSTITIPTAPLTTSASNTTLLLNFTNAGITDATAKNDLETVGNAQISTTQSKFGGSSMYFDGTGDYLTVPNAGGRFDFGTGDFTIEFWMYAPSGVVDFADTVISKGPPGTVDNTSWTIQGSGTGGNIQFLGPSSTVYATTTSTPWTSAWTHIAICRAGSNTRCFVNGTQFGSTYTTLQNFEPGNPLIVGSGYYDPAGRSYNGYLDDVRITKGYARYTANFTAPTTAFALQ